MNGKIPVISVYTFTVSWSDIIIAANAKFVVSSLGEKRYIYISSYICSLFIDLVFFRIWSKCTKVVASDFGRYVGISLAVRPGYVNKIHFYGLKSKLI